MKTKELIAALKEKGITKWRISKVLGVHWNTVNAWSKETFQPTKEHKAQLESMLS